MKIGIAGHIAIDEVEHEGEFAVNLGGPPSYSGLVASSLGSSVYLYTKIGLDFPEEFSKRLSINNLFFESYPNSTTHYTTRFRFRLDMNGGRSMQLVARCEDLDIPDPAESQSFDGILLSPIAGELSISGASSFLDYGTTSLLDPQGYLRAFDSEGTCRARTFSVRELPLSTIIRMNKQEAQMLTTRQPLLNCLREIIKKGFEIVIGTDDDKEVIVLDKTHTFRLSIPPTKQVIDTIGLGDIFNAAFLQTFLSQNDTLWAASVATVIASRSNSSLGINKVNVSDYEEKARTMFDRASRI